MTVKIDDVVKKYMALRTQKEEIEREAKDKVAGVKATMEKLEAYLLQRMEEDGVTSFKTPYGTAFSTEKEFAGVADWQSVVDYVKERDAFHLLEKRVSKTALRTWMDEGNELPPGVNWTTERDVNIRKPSNSVKD